MCLLEKKKNHTLLVSSGSVPVDIDKHRRVFLAASSVCAYSSYSALLLATAEDAV